MSPEMKMRILGDVCHSYNTFLLFSFSCQYSMPIRTAVMLSRTGIFTMSRLVFQVVDRFGC